MYIYPNTDIRILSGVPLNNDYDNTILFQTLNDQTNYFIGKTKINLTNHSYQRKSRGCLKVRVPQNNLWDCSYLMYRNTSYGNKWFYAFILSTEYINDANTLINFEIDVMQTWMFDYQLQECYVEREHTETDNLFENLVEENLMLGDDYVIQDTDYFDLTPTRLLILSTDDFGEHLPDSDFIENTYYYPLKRYSFDLSTSQGRENIQSFMEAFKAEGSEAEIVQICQYPAFMSPNTSTQPVTTAYKTFETQFTSIDGYTPKNNKLYTYPYNFLHVTNHEGISADFKWELWTRTHIGEFTIKGCSTGKPCVVMYPNHYRKIVDDIDSGVYANNFPENPWTGDAWQLYWAQHGASYETANILGIINGSVQTAGAIAGASFNFSGGQSTSNSESVFDSASEYTNVSGNSVNSGASQRAGTSQMSGYGSREGSGYNVHVNPFGAIQGLVNIGGVIARDIAFKKDLMHQPNQSYGQKNADILSTFIGFKQYELQHYTIKHQFAQIIDEYFSRFGYACKRIKVPNTNARQYWTYTKTMGCEITATIPIDDATKIKKIYDHGITFWNNPSQFGNFGNFSNPVYS